MSVGQVFFVAIQLFNELMREHERGKASTEAEKRFAALTQSLPKEPEKASRRRFTSADAVFSFGKTDAKAERELAAAGLVEGSERGWFGETPGAILTMTFKDETGASKAVNVLEEYYRAEVDPRGTTVRRVTAPRLGDEDFALMTKRADAPRAVYHVVWRTGNKVDAFFAQGEQSEVLPASVSGLLERARA